MIILSFPVGKFIDKVGRKIPLIISNLLAIPGILLFIFGNYLALFIALPLTGFSMLMGFSAYQTMFADLVPQDQRGKVTGSVNFFGNVFMAFGGAIGGLLYDILYPQFPFLLATILAIPATALVAFWVSEPKPEEREA
jgi:MFS family permease